MKKIPFEKIPEQIWRLSILLIILVILFIITRLILVPPDFGEYGHFRTSAVTEIIAQDIHYAGQQACNECHDDIMKIRNNGYHKDVSCEVCHGSAAAHIEDIDAVELQAPRKRSYCPLCHEYLQSRPTGFPQIISASHNPMKACINCHDPHNPNPPETPKECAACHAEIARTKSLSRHVYVPCTHCHQTPEKHKISPREFLPSKPKDRAFCGGCHSEEADSERGIPRINLATHEPRYLCWQCHYPHLPETD